MNQADLSEFMGIKRARVVNVRDRLNDLLKAYAEASNDVCIKMWQENISLTPLRERLTYYKTAVDPFYRDLFRELITTNPECEIDIRQSINEDFYTFCVSTADIINYAKLEYFPSKPMGASDFILIEWNIVNKDRDNETLQHDQIYVDENGKKSLLYVISGLLNGIDPCALGFKKPTFISNGITL